MADKKKMSVADILAAARKSDGGADDAASESAGASEAAAEAAAAPASEAPAAASGPPQKIPKPGSADRPSAADILAMARAGKSAESSKPAAKAAKPAAQSKAQSKAKAGGDKASPKQPTKAAAAAPRDTASILAAARKKDKPGPMSKSEAAAKATSPAAGKAKIVVPPMPEKPAYAQPSTAPAPPEAKGGKQPAKKAGAKAEAAGEDRRGFLMAGFAGLSAATFLWTMAVVKFMFPNVLREPPSKFKVGFPDAFPSGQVATKYKAQFGVWVINTEYNGQSQLVALKTVCTHLGCTPNWLEAEQKFKCPCHGSGFYKDGINFEGLPLARWNATRFELPTTGKSKSTRAEPSKKKWGNGKMPAATFPYRPLDDAGRRRLELDQPT